MTRSPGDLMRVNLLRSSTNPTPPVGPRSSPRTTPMTSCGTNRTGSFAGDKVTSNAAPKSCVPKTRTGSLRSCRRRGPELDDVGHLGFHYGPADQSPIATGMDIARTRDGVIIELYTIVTEIRQPS